MTKRPTLEEYEQAHTAAQLVQRVVERHILSTTEARSKGRRMLREEIGKDARYAVSATEMLVREAREEINCEEVER